MNKRLKKKFIQKCRRKKYPSKHNRRIIREIAKSISDPTRKVTYVFPEYDPEYEMLHRFQELMEEYENLLIKTLVDDSLKQMEDLLNGK